MSAPGRGKSRRQRVAAVSLVCVVGAALSVPAAAQAAKRINAEFPYRFNPSTVEIDQGERLTFLNADTNAADNEHDVTAVDKGADGNLLFKTPIIPPGQEVFVDGSQYLTAGSYRFICSVHPVGMRGTLNVTTAGAPVPRPRTEPPPQPPRDATRPNLSLEIATSRAGAIHRKGRVVVRTGVTEPARISLTVDARVGGRTIPLGQTSFDFSKASSRSLVVRVTSAARRKLRSAMQGRSGALIRVSGRADDRAANTTAGRTHRKLRA